MTNRQENFILLMYVLLREVSKSDGSIDLEESNYIYNKNKSIEFNINQVKQYTNKLEKTKIEKPAIIVIEVFLIAVLTVFWQLLTASV